MSNRFALRDATHGDHLALDAKASRVDLSSSAGYRSFLRWHAAVVPALELHLERHGIDALLPDWSQRTRRDALASDLAAMDEQTTKSAPDYSIGSHPAALWGIAYVLEGSRLGATVLVAKVPPQIRLTASRYLSHGHSARLWPSFSRALDDAHFSDSDMQDASASARAVFALFAASVPEPVAPDELYLAR